VVSSTASRGTIYDANGEILAISGPVQNVILSPRDVLANIKVEETDEPKGIRLTLTDDGVPFDPLAVRDPDTSLSAEKRAVGGMGILIVKKTMSPVKYERKDGRNVLTMGLKISG